MDQTYAGIRWQCVEFARRWLITRRGHTFPSIDVAADLWHKVPELQQVRGHEKIPLRNHANGAEQLPRDGDLLVYAREYLGTGHVAVVLGVDTARRRVQVGEENLRNTRWPGAYAREIPYVQEGAGYWLLDPYLLGWKSVVTP